MLRSIVFGLGLLLATSTAAMPAGSDPTTVTNTFYRWYFSVASTGWTTHLAQAKPYLVPSLYAALSKTATLQMKTHEAVIDVDPFTGLQEPATSFLTGTTDIQGTTAHVPVMLKTKAGSPQVTIVLKNSNGWRIDNIVYGSVNLRSMLAQAMK